MNDEKLKQFLIPIAIIVLIAVGLVYGGQKIGEKVQTLNNINQEIVTKTESIKEKEEKLAEYKRKEQEEKAKAQESSNGQKPFYKPIESGMDTEAVIAGEFAEILQLVRSNKIKVRSIKYDYDPEDDNFVKGAKEKYNVARLNMEMVSNYSDYDNFLKEMYKHQHFLDIQSAEIVPYKKNKKLFICKTIL